MYHRAFTQHNPKSWYKLLPWVAYWYNTAFPSAIGMNSYRAVFGRDPPQILRYTPAPHDEVTVSQQERDMLLDQRKRNLHR